MPRLRDVLPLGVSRRRRVAAAPGVAALQRRCAGGGGSDRLRAELVVAVDVVTEPLVELALLWKRSSRWLTAVALWSSGLGRFGLGEAENVYVVMRGVRLGRN